MKAQIHSTEEFSLRIPEGFTSRREEDPDGQWGYGEFFQHYIRQMDGAECTNCFFYYWKKDKSQPSEKQYEDLVRRICKEKLFTARHSLKLIGKNGITFKRLPGLLLKFRYSHQDPEASGPANFFLFYHKKKKKVFILGAIIHQQGNPIAERDCLARVEDEFIKSFRFKKSS